MTLEEELLLDEAENRREVEFIRRQLSMEAKEHFSDDDLLWFIDSIADYYYTSGVLETTADEVDIDLEEAAAQLCLRAKEELNRSFDADEVFFIVQADLDFQEQEL